MTEVLVTMLLLTITLTGLAGLQVQFIRQVTSSRRAAEATRLAQSTVDRYLSMDLPLLQAMAVDTPDWVIPDKRSAPGEAMKDVGVDGVKAGPFTVKQLIENAADGRIMITIMVTWIDGSINSTGGTKELNVMVAAQRSS